MSVQLSQPDFQNLVRIVANLPDFANVRDRRRLVVGALEGVPRAETILARLDLDGAPMGVAVEVVRFLAQFGQVAYNKEALEVFLNHIQPFVNDEDAEFLASLFAAYAPLDAQVSRGRTIDHWRGRDTAHDLQEKIIGENTLRHVRMLALALDAAGAVVHLRSARGGKEHLGTGFMIASDLLMTNHHVIQDRAEAEAAVYTFNYQLDRAGKECAVSVARALTGGIFHTNAGLDYTITQLAGTPAFGEPLALKRIQMRQDERVSIIQHPAGHLKQISMQNNFVAYADARTVQYTTTTLPGSSGAPVFNEDFEVVAIHHSGGLLPDPGTGKRYLCNEGTSMIAVLDDIKGQAPEVYERLRV
ncbi:MAG: trypsin-like peptidase domain-containing protein [Anaerolineae bacterium]|nr:trypsin-like peptidase domain-containing protein [Anaerolineae bacterium]